MVQIAIRECRPGAAISDAGAMEQFAKRWATYQKLVDNNALSHREVAAHLHRSLAPVEAPFAFLDIACGDAGNMIEIMSGTAIASYRGIDLSAPALELAARHLAAAPFAIALDHGDFVEALEGGGEAADIAWCGLSFHHLATSEKRKVMKALRRTTRKFALIYEPTLRDGEDRDGYMRRFAEVMHPAWQGFLTPDEWDEIYTHVSTCDLPETSETWREMGLAAGFSSAKELFCDAAGFHRIYRYDV